MTPLTETTHAPGAAVREVVDWRLGRLLAAGFEAKHAALLAPRLDIDLHEAVNLLERGCPYATAVRILF